METLKKQSVRSVALTVARQKGCLKKHKITQYYRFVCVRDREREKEIHKPFYVILFLIS